MIWTREKILLELRRLHKKDQELSYNGLARRNQSLVSAAAYHYGSYRKAVEAAGIEYAEVLRRPRWTKVSIIGVIKKAKRAGHDLHWSAVINRNDELARAAYASLQPRLFGRWDRALAAAGLDSDDIALYRRWDRESIVYELRSRSKSSESLNSGAIQSEDPGLHAAAVRHFGSYDQALSAAKIDPARVRIRRRWKRDDVIKAIQGASRNGDSLSDSDVRKMTPALYGAAVRLFGSFVKARAASKVKAE